jgi:hypothetical protein
LASFKEVKVIDGLGDSESGVDLRFENAIDVKFRVRISTSLSHNYFSLK